MSDPPTGRTTVNAHTTPFLPYDLEGPVQPEMSWLPLSFDRETQQGTYLMRTRGWRSSSSSRATSSTRTGRSSARATS